MAEVFRGEEQTLVDRLAQPIPMLRRAYIERDGASQPAMH